MIQIVFKPEKAPVVKGEALYRAVFDQKEGLFLVRARNAAEAERKTMIVMRHELAGKTVDFDAGGFPDYDSKGECDDRNSEEGEAEAPGGREAHDPAPAREGP